MSIFKTSKRPPSIDLPPLAPIESRDGELGRIASLRASLGDERRGLVDEMNRLADDLDRSDGNGSDPHLTIEEERLQALISGKAVPKADSRRQRLAEIERRLSDIDAANTLLATRYEYHRRRASALLRDEIAPVHRTKVRALVDALIVANRAQAELYALVDTVLDTGAIADGLHDLNGAEVLGAPRDSYSRLAHFLRDAVRAGVVAKEDIPEALR